MREECIHGVEAKRRCVACEADRPCCSRFLVPELADLRAALARAEERAEKAEKLVDGWDRREEALRDEYLKRIEAECALDAERARAEGALRDWNVLKLANDQLRAELSAERHQREKLEAAIATEIQARNELYRELQTERARSARVREEALEEAAAIAHRVVMGGTTLDIRDTGRAMEDAIRALISPSTKADET